VIVAASSEMTSVLSIAVCIGVYIAARLGVHCLALLDLATLSLIRACKGLLCTNLDASILSF